MFIFYLGVIDSVHAQQLQFNSLAVTNGSSQQDERDIIKESEGFIWIGTCDGLNRFDGYEIENIFTTAML